MTTTISRILAPTDFSENAGIAVKRAAAYARAHQASMTLIHVADAVSMSSLPLAIQEQISSRLGDLADTIGAEGIEVNVIETAGRAWERIAEESQEYDLVVIGARGLTPHPGAFIGIGSTADRVLRTAEAPVLTVHESDAGRQGLPRRILAPTDFSDTASRAFDCALAVLCPTADDPLDVTLLHAWQPLADYEFAFGNPIAFAPDLSDEAAEAALKARADEMQSDAVRVTPLLRAGYPTHVIEETAKQMEAELIAIGTHGRSGFTRWMLGSVAERVVHHAACPVLTTRQAVAAAGAPEDKAQEVAS